MSGKTTLAINKLNCIVNAIQDDGCNETYNELGFNKFGYNKLGYIEQIFWSEIIIYYTTQHGYNNPRM